MNWRWLLLDYVPPELALTPEQRKAVTKRMYQLRHFSRRIMWVLFGFGPLAGLTLPYLSFRVLDSWLPTVGLPGGWSRLIAAIAPLLVFAIAYEFLLARLYVGPMRQALREAGHDICLSCGYWLRGLDEDIPRCPECGTLREPLPEQTTA